MNNVQKFQKYIDEAEMNDLEKLFNLTLTGSLDHFIELYAGSTPDDKQRMRHALYENYLKRSLVRAKDVFYQEIKDSLSQKEAEELFEVVNKIEKVIQQKYSM